METSMSKETKHKSHADALVCFGATGDLAFKKIFPALQSLVTRGQLDVPVIGVGRSDGTDDQLRARVRGRLKQHGGADPVRGKQLCALLRYVMNGEDSQASIQDARRMLPRDRGVILQVGSALAYRGIPLQSAYCAAKHAIQGFCDSLRSELIHDQSRVQVCMLQMPALNTPQFGWVKSRLPHKAQPVPPIYQPEVAADAIVYASHHPRREFYVGWPAMQAIVGDKLIPGLLDHYLARTGFSGQQTDEPEDPDRPDNLWTPVPGDRGAHGSFDARAHAFSPLFWANRHRAWFMVAGGLAMAAAAMAFLTDRDAVPSEAGPTDA
jgi:NAD(P)-dependent dehydrogenase (short-subunit alcohol dehydrogenase family)